MLRFLIAIVALGHFTALNGPIRAGLSDCTYQMFKENKKATDTGNTIHNRVIAESKTIRYVLTCDDLFPPKKAPILCTPVEAGQDYDARVWPTAVDFGEANDGKFRLIYDIESQVEK